MKKALKFFGIGLGLFLLLLIIAPFVFKDKIVQTVQQELDRQIDATVLFDPARTSLSLLRNFPHFSLAVEEFGIINKEPFEGDTLFYARQFNVVVDLLSVLKGKRYEIKKIVLNDVVVQVFILPDGRNNYSIMKPAEPDNTAAEAEAETSAFALKIDHWEIGNLNLNYIDGTSGTAASLLGLNHSGSGDFSDQLVDLQMKTSINDLSLNYDSTNYLKHKRFDSDIKVAWNSTEKAVTFGENYLQLNDFRFSFAGKAIFGGDKPQFDLNFASNQADIKGLLSLVPAVYASNFDQLEAGGTLAFNGSVKGFYDSTSLPGFQTRLLVKNGRIKYPQLPQAVENLEIDFTANHAQGDLEQSKFNLANFSLKIGQNPLFLKARADGLSTPQLSVDARGKVNLEEALAVFPVEGLKLKGLFSFLVNANGKLNMAEKVFPTLKADLALDNGFARTDQFPEALEGVTFRCLAQNPDGKVASTVVDLSQLAFKMAGEPFSMRATFKNPEDLNYDVSARGKVNLEKITQIFPVEGATLKGVFETDLNTRGVLSDVEAKRYDKLPTSGTARLSQFTYASKDLARPISIADAQLAFSSKEMQLKNMDMKVGKSDFLLNGILSYYIPYMMKGETLVGKLQLQSGFIDVNELMALSTAGPAPAPAETSAPMAVPQLPENIQFAFQARVDKMRYDNLDLSEGSGLFELKNGAAHLQNLNFSAMDGKMGMSGKFDPSNPLQPAYSFDFDMRQVSIAKAYANFSTLSTLVPAARHVQGQFSTLFHLDGRMDNQMKPDLPQTNGSGIIKLQNAKVSQFTLLEGVNKLVKTNLPAEVALQNVSIKAKVENGRVSFEPFSFPVAGRPLTLSGSQGLDGSIDYRIQSSAPAGPAGAAVAGALGQLTGTNLSSPKEIKFEIAATGSAASPKYRIVKVDAGGAGAEAKSAVTEKLNQAKAEAEARAKAEAERLKQEAEAKARQEAEKAKREAEEKAKEELNKLKKKLPFKL